jgi:hypothetical protein
VDFFEGRRKTGKNFASDEISQPKTNKDGEKVGENQEGERYCFFLRGVIVSAKHTDKNIKM